MTKPEQLDLFSTRTASVVVFPLHRRVTFVAAVAANLHRLRTRKKRQAYWDDLLARLQTQLIACGCSEATTDRDLERFWSAVDAEMRGSAWMKGFA